MELVEEKLKNFEQIVKDQAEKKAEEILNAVREENEKEFSKYEERLDRKMAEQIILEERELLVENRKEFSRFQTEQRSLYFNRQQDLEADLFKKLEDKLAQYSATKEYEKNMLDKANEIEKEHWDGLVTILVRPEDRALGEKIQKIFGESCKIKESKSIQLGGFIYQNEQKRYVVDETLDRAVKDSKEWFRKTASLPDAQLERK